MPPLGSKAMSPIRGWTDRSGGGGGGWGHQRMPTGLRHGACCPSLELPATVCTQEEPRGDRDRPALWTGEASDLGVPEATQDIIERVHVLDPVAEAKVGVQGGQAVESQCDPYTALNPTLLVLVVNRIARPVTGGKGKNTWP